MSLQNECARILPPSLDNALADVFNCFRVVGEIYQKPFNPKQIEETTSVDLENAGRDYFVAGLAYLATRIEDAKLRELGSTVWHTLDYDKSFMIFNGKSILMAIQMGIPKKVSGSFTKDNQPFIKIEESLIIKSTEGTILQIGFDLKVLIPALFILKAKERPFEALADITKVASLVRDAVNGIDDKAARIRAEAFQAQFLHHFARNYPSICRPIDYRDIMNKYPKGVFSLNKDLQNSGVVLRDPFENSSKLEVIYPNERGLECPTPLEIYNN